MKKIARLLMFAGMALALLSLCLELTLTSGAQARRAYLLILPEKFEIPVGGETSAKVQLYFDPSPGEKLEGWAFNICYDSDVLELVESKPLWNCSKRGPDCEPEIWREYPETGVFMAEVVSYSGKGITKAVLQDLLELRFRGKAAGRARIYFCDWIEKPYVTALVLSGQEVRTNNKNVEIFVV